MSELGAKRCEGVSGEDKKEGPGSSGDGPAAFIRPGACFIWFVSRIFSSSCYTRVLILEKFECPDDHSHERYLSNLLSARELPALVLFVGSVFSNRAGSTPLTSSRPGWLEALRSPRLS